MLTLKIKPDYEKYFSYPRLYSYGPQISTYILIGGRSIGKTTGALFQAISNFNKNDEQFVQVRRYATATKKSRGLLSKLVDCSVSGGGKNSIMTYTETATKKPIGYSIPLTAQDSVKSGFNFEKVTTIIFDEITILNGTMQHYLKDEIYIFWELLSTIVRERTMYKIYLLGNNNDIFNPYVEYFNIDLRKKPYIDYERGLYFEMCKTKEKLLEAEKQTPLYRLTKGTAYHEYHYNNEVLTGGHINLGVKSGYATLLTRMLFNKVTLNIYLQPKTGNLFVEYRNKRINDSLAYNIMENNEYNLYYCRRFKESNIGQKMIRYYYLNGIEYQNNESYAILSTYMKYVL